MLLLLEVVKTLKKKKNLTEYLEPIAGALTGGRHGGREAGGGRARDTWGVSRVTGALQRQQEP